MEVSSHNRRAWDRLVEEGNRWTIPASDADLAEARAGRVTVLLTETKPVPQDWLPDLAGAEVLCLASGGGQQGPILAAAGATVTVFDNSPKQLERDREVADKYGLDLKTILGDMRDLSELGGRSFDLIFHPVSNVFVPDVRPVWAECARVLRVGGALLSGFVNPVEYMFDPQLMEIGELKVKYALPYSDLESLTEAERSAMHGEDAPLEFSHTLAELIGGQIEAGFVITGFYEDYRSDSKAAEFMPSYLATRARLSQAPA